MQNYTDIEKAALAREAEMLVNALEQSKENNGVWLNSQKLKAPTIYPKGVSVSPFNSLLLGLHSEQNKYPTNLYTTFGEAKNRNEGVREHERGVPFHWYNWKSYTNRNNPEDIISRQEYQKLSPEEQKQYKGVKSREVRYLFNLQQTVMPMADDKKYAELVKANGCDRADSKEDIEKRYDDFIKAINDNLVKVQDSNKKVGYYDASHDVVNRIDVHNLESIQDTLRSVVSATGSQGRLAREGMVNHHGVAPSEDALRYEKLVVEVASAIKIQELGLSGTLDKESMKYRDYWIREFKENPCLIDALESDVNASLQMIQKAERGEKVERSFKSKVSITPIEQPPHYTIADEIKQYPNEENKTVVIVRDTEKKVADVVLPQGASLEADNEIKGMSKARYTKALNKEGFETVNFYNPDGAIGFRPSDDYFAGKTITVSRLMNWSLENISTLNAADAVAHSKDVNFESVQMMKDDSDRWAMYVKPEGMDGFSVYPEKPDLNLFFTTMKQNIDNLDTIRMELANKYYTLAADKPELKVDLFGGNASEDDMKRIDRVSIYRTKDGESRCFAVIDGEKQKPKPISASQWQRLWIAPDRDTYKRQLAACLFAEVLGKVKNEDITDKKDVTEQQNQQVQTTKAMEKEMKAVEKQYEDLKIKHPDAVLLFRKGDFYEAYKADAEKASKILAIGLEQRGSIIVASFPHHALDTYLPKLVRAGERVAICDLLEEPKQTVVRRGNEQTEEQHQSGGMRR